MSHFKFFLKYLQLKRSIFAVFNKPSFKFAYNVNEGKISKNKIGEKIPMYSQFHYALF